MSIKINWGNTLTSVVLAISIGIFSEIRSTHDAVLKLQGQMSGVEAEVVDLRARVVAVEIDMQNLRKENHLK